MIGLSDAELVPRWEHAVYDGRRISHYDTPLWADYFMVDISAVRVVPVPQRSALKRRLVERELSEDVSFGVGIPLGCRAIGLGKPPQGCV